MFGCGIAVLGLALVQSGIVITRTVHGYGRRKRPPRFKDEDTLSYEECLSLIHRYEHILAQRIWDSPSHHNLYSGTDWLV